MDFHRYPVDEQTCEIKFESFGYTLKQVRKYHLTIFNFEQFGTTALHRTVGPHLCYDKWKGQRLRDFHCKKLCKLGS